MAPRFSPLSASAQAAYAQLLDAALGAEIVRSIADLPGTFASKEVKGRRYWYYQYLELSGKKRQVYVGPDEERVRQLIAARDGDGTRAALQPLAGSAVALGNAALDLRHFKVVQRLSDYGFFRAGGVLIGTHAFLALGNMLGVRWRDGQRTQDVDFAHPGKALAIALPGDLDLDLRGAIESLQMGLLPIQHLDGHAGATWLDPREPEFQLDFLTTMHREGLEPYQHPKLGILLQPLKFMEYLLQDPQQAVVFTAGAACVVNVPDPARYALHKLIVAGERPAARIAKSNKDVLQAASLLGALSEIAPARIEPAWRDMRSRGPGWTRRMATGTAALARSAPELDLATLLPQRKRGRE